MQLLIFRHGIAEDLPATGRDFDRRLTPRGVERTTASARGLTELCDAPELILTSPKVRAVQTAQIAAEAFDRPVEADEVIAEGTAADIRDMLTGRKERRLMLVGHEPTLSELIERLIADRPLRGGLLLKKAGAALVDIGLGRGEESDPGILHWLLPPRALRIIGGERP